MKSSCNNKKRKSHGTGLRLLSNVYRFGTHEFEVNGEAYVMSRDWLLIKPQKKLPKLTA